jgi:hypothetical protein
MLIASRYSGLSTEEATFLERVIPVGPAVQAQTVAKCQDRDVPIETATGMYASFIIAYCLHRSRWGKHPVAQPKIKQGEKQVNGNNFGLVNTDSSWDRFRATIKYRGSIYKSYRDVGDFICDMSDTFAWRYNYTNEIAAPTVTLQVQVFARRSNRPVWLQQSLLKLISDFRLFEFDRRY